MMIRIILNICLTALLMICMPIISFAQTSGDKLYEEGKILPKTQTITSQNQAIKKFQTAKVVYTTSDDKEKCEARIAQCKSTIAVLKKPRGKRVNPNKGSSSPGSQPSIALSQKSVEFDGDKPGKVTINVDASSLDWKIEIPEGIERETNFVQVTRSNDAKSIEITAQANTSTLMRIQTVNVTLESISQEITIKQQGKAVKLSTNKNLIEFGLKGGSKTIELFTNSDSIISSNNDLTWFVESKPEWLDVSVGVKKKKGLFGKISSGISNLVAGQVEVASDDDMKQSEVKIVATSLKKSDKEYETGRRGEIIFTSQDKHYKVIVVQQK